MPTNSTVSNHSSQRRPGGVTRGRENGPQTPSRGSHTPEPRAVEEAPRMDPPNLVRKRRKTGTTHPQCHPSTSNNLSHPQSRQNTKFQRDPTALVETDRKSKAKHRPTSGDVDMLTVPETQPRTNGKARRADRSRSRDTPRTSAKEEDTQEERTSSGYLAATEHARLKMELDSWKKRAHNADKKLNKRNEEIEKLRKDLASLHQSDAERSSELEKLKKQSKKSSDIISSIEGHMSCNICMDLMLKPFGLSPCGHVLCQTCLQEWFRTAPGNAADMIDDDSPEALLYRKKTCPVCRAIVRTRPIPLFLVKSIATALAQSKPDTPRRESPAPETDTADPWEGIFIDPANEDDSHSEDEDTDEDDYEDPEDQWSSDYDYDYGSGSEDDFSSYAHARWAPPTVNITPFDFPFIGATSPEDLSMLRRGCTPAMIELFSMEYMHHEGLIAHVDGNALYLGWNITLNDDDETGEEFIDWCLRDIHERPDRWEKVDHGDGTWSAWKHIPENEDRDYGSDEDSDVWAARMAAEDDDDDDIMYEF